MKIFSKFIAIAAVASISAMGATAQTVTVYMKSGATVNFEDNSHLAVVLNDDGIPPVLAQAVDLGLPSGTLWADMNLGATRSSDMGMRVAWGETFKKDAYSWATYTHCNGDYQSMIKYCTSETYGTVDNLTELEPEDDAATVLMGAEWTIPTSTQLDELRTNATWTWTLENGVPGYLVTGPNGNSIFLPSDANRLAFYWTKSLSIYYPYSAHHLYIDFEAYNHAFGSRFEGEYVRAVKK